MKLQQIVLFFTTMILLFSCGNKEVLSPEKLEDVLVDMHLAEGVALSLPSDFKNVNAKTDLYTAVYEKHGITSAQFDSTISYYSYDLTTLTEVYDSVVVRIEKYEEQVKLGQYAISKKIASQSVYSRIVEADSVLLPFVAGEFWNKQRDVRFKDIDFDEGDTFMLDKDSIGTAKVNLRFELQSDSIEAASITIELTPTEGDMIAKTFDLPSDISSQLMNFEWDILPAKYSMSVKIKADKMNNNSKLRLKDIRFYSLSTEAHDVSIFQ